MNELDNRRPCQCSPSIPQTLCELCARYQPRLPDNPEFRPRIVLPDVSTVAKPGSCPMAIPRTA